jgi:hypothetical protein
MHVRLKSSILASILKTPGMRREEREAREKATELLRFVGLRSRETFAKNLPYGDQRRLEIARALASEPKLLLLDEPTAGMNPQETARITQLIGRLRDERGISVLLIEHEMRVVMSISDRVTVLDHGEKISEGTPAQVPFYGAFIKSIFPSSFSFNVSVLVLCMVILGGMGNIYGVILGAIVLQGINFYLLPQVNEWVHAIGEALSNPFLADVDLPKYNFFLFGVLLVVMMLLRPEGIIPNRQRQEELREGDEDDSATGLTNA